MNAMQGATMNLSPETPDWIVQLTEPMMEAERDDGIAIMCKDLGILPPTDFPRPGEALNMSVKEIQETLEPFGFEMQPDEQAHGYLFQHTLFPVVRHGFAKTPSDFRAHMNSMGDLRLKYTDAILGLSKIMVTLLADWEEKVERLISDAEEGEESETAVLVAELMEAAQKAKSLTHLVKSYPEIQPAARAWNAYVIVGISDREAKRLVNLLNKVERELRQSPRKVLINQCEMSSERVERLLTNIKMDNMEGVVTSIGSADLVRLEDYIDRWKAEKEATRAAKKKARKQKSSKLLVRDVPPPPKTGVEKHAEVFTKAKEGIETTLAAIVPMLSERMTQSLAALAEYQTDEVLAAELADAKDCINDRDEEIQHLQETIEGMGTDVDCLRDQLEQEKAARREIAHSFSGFLDLVQAELQDGDFLAVAKAIESVRAKAEEEQAKLLEHL